MDIRSFTSRPDALWAGLGPALAIPDGSMLDLFEAVVARDPDRPAVLFRNQVFTFGELDGRADGLARQLREKGAVTGGFVPLAIAEGTEFPIGLLAAMKLGAPFVPIDPQWPASRLDTLFRQLAPRVVLAVESTLPALRAVGVADRAILVDRAIPTDRDAAAPAGTPATAPAVGPAGTPGGGSASTPTARSVAGVAAVRRPGPDDLIYGYFTSGSTGVPKCALNRHRGLVNRMAAMSCHFGDGADQVVLQNSKPTFDSSMWQVLWPLTTGGLVVLPDRRGILDLEQTCHILARHAVTITDFVPSVLGTLVSLLELRPDLRAELAGLRRMLIGGEEANPVVLRRLRKLLPGLRVTNTFGPTECSIGSVFHHIEDLTGQIPLGTPIPNTAAVVLDDALRPVPPETVGEIYIGGVCVGAGYLGDPERTERAFVPNPFPEIEGERLYRTGDLGRHTAAGLLMFHGRRDDQVKVGGVRIELAEVERVLGAHPRVRSAAVIVRGEGDSRSLAAFATVLDAAVLDAAASSDVLVPGVTVPGATVSDAAVPGAAVTSAGLLDWLRERLPPETVPRTLTLVEAIPLTPHGKLDRRALERIVREAADTGSVEPPATADEELVAAAWREVLDLDEVSVVTPFASYGGTSLLTHRIAALLTIRRDRTVRPADLISAETVRDQARLLGVGAAPVVAVDPAQLARDADPTGLVEPPVPVPPARARRLLLTGGTGFIGAHVLAELLARPQVELACLVRAADPPAGAARLTDTLRAYGLVGSLPALDQGLKTGRVRVVAGDLAAPTLGLTEARFRALAGEVAAVLHSGAMVNFLRDYATHRAPNVAGTRELIRLAAAGDGCRLHVLSTLGIFSGLSAIPGLSGLPGPSADLGLSGPALSRPALSDAAAGPGSDAAGGKPVDPRRLPDLAAPPAGGYEQSKLVTEHLLAGARALGVDSVVYRLGEVWPHRTTGVPNPASLAHLVVYAAARTGVVFPTSARTDHLAVDVLARYLADAATGPRPLLDTVHLLHPVALRYTDIFARLAEAGAAEPLGYPEFHFRLTALADRDGADDRLVRVAMLLPPPGEEPDRAAPAAFDRLFTDSSGWASEVGLRDHRPTRRALSGGSPIADVASFLRRLSVES